MVQRFKQIVIHLDKDGLHIVEYIDESGNGTI
jgi:hypothetical protein